ncbi:MAG: transposase [Kosmotogaceae bacterium]|nr:transposase [Kosmotogaceae bacterium]
MIIQRAYKTELAPNNVQRTMLRKHAGAARFAWNWALSRIVKKESKPNAMGLHRELNALKPTQFPWMYEVSKCAPQEALRNLQTAFTRFFKENKNGNKSGFPKFKSRRRNKSSFKLTGTVKVEDKRIQLPRLGWLRLKEHGYFPKEAKILSVTCSEHAGRWFVSVSVQEEINPVAGSGVLGIDLGIKTLATCSDGTVFENPKALISNQKRLKKLQKRHSRQKKAPKGGRRQGRELAGYIFGLDASARILFIRRRVGLRKPNILKSSFWKT